MFGVSSASYSKRKKAGKYGIIIIKLSHPKRLNATLRNKKISRVIDWPQMTLISQFLLYLAHQKMIKVIAKDKYICQKEKRESE